MAVAMIDVEVWVLVNECGDYVASDDADALNERFEECVGEIANQEGLRRVKLTVKVPLPNVIEIKGEVKTCEEAGELQAV
jgi:hypothetical protein